jgi:hypothetical protein
VSAPPTRADLIASSGDHHCGRRARRRRISRTQRRTNGRGYISRHARWCGLPVDAPAVRHVHATMRYAPAVRPKNVAVQPVSRSTSGMCWPQ